MLLRASFAVVILWVIAGVVSGGYHGDGPDTRTAVAGDLMFGQQLGAGTWNDVIPQADVSAASTSASSERDAAATSAS